MYRKKYICLCNFVSEEQIRAAMEQGSLDLEKISLQTKAGSSCASCQEKIKKLIDEYSN